ncbi:hypothetical protein TWF102_003914 [Orbilia oligospora]|uniref:F-box domain-containing protein n=1 Tax=Orbilia oligospora TaxID=2813651 RepID=A0A7C8JCY3_ORBOL|nr:hypothetical protein TWF102_003914 [Orbilia oligospora]
MSTSIATNEAAGLELEITTVSNVTVYTNDGDHDDEAVVSTSIPTPTPVTSDETILIPPPIPAVRNDSVVDMDTTTTAAGGVEDGIPSSGSSSSSSSNAPADWVIVSSGSSSASSVTNELEEEVSLEGRIGGEDGVERVDLTSSVGFVDGSIGVPSIPSTASVDDTEQEATPLIIDEGVPPSDIQTGTLNEDIPPSSSSSRIEGAILETDTPESSEPSTPTMREITVLEGEAMVVPVANEEVAEREEVPAAATAVEEVAVVEEIQGVLPGVLPAAEENVVVNNTEDGVEAVVTEEAAGVEVPVVPAEPAEGNEAEVAAAEEVPPPAGDPAVDPVDPAGQAEQPEATDPPAEETTAPAEPEPEPEPPWVYDPTQPTTILAIPPEIILHVFNFLPLYNMKEFSLCSKRCRSLAIRRIFKHVNISSDALKAFQKGGELHYIADAVFGIVIRTRYIGYANELCTFMKECMYTSEKDGKKEGEGEEEGETGLGVFSAVRRIKVSYGQIRYDRMSALVNTGPLDSLSALDAQFIKAMFLSLRKVKFWKKIRWVDFVVKLWEDRHGVFDEPVEEGNEVKPEDKPGYLTDENATFLENILDSGVDDFDDGKDMVAIAPALKDVRLINFKPRRRVAYRRKVDIFEVLACMGGKPEKVVLEYISAGESIDLAPGSRIDEVRVQRGVEEIWVNMASFDVPGFMDEIARRFVDLKSLMLIVTTAGGEGYLLPAKGVSGPWRRGVLEKMEKIKGLKTFMVPVRVGQEGENINHGRRKELGEVPKDTIERLAELVIYWIENGADDLEKVIFERKELEDEVDSAVGPGWICNVRWENKRPKLEWTVENLSVAVS